MPTRRQLHDLVDRLPETEILAVHRMLLVCNADPALYALLTAPLDDEPVTDQERRAVAEARAEVEAGAKCYTTEELNKELGL